MDYRIGKSCDVRTSSDVARWPRLLLYFLVTCNAELVAAFVDRVAQASPPVPWAAAHQRFHFIAKIAYQGATSETAKKLSMGVKAYQGTASQVAKKILVCEDLYQDTSLPSGLLTTLASRSALLYLVLLMLLPSKLLPVMELPVRKVDASFVPASSSPHARLMKTHRKLPDLRTLMVCWPRP